MIDARLRGALGLVVLAAAVGGCATAQRFVPSMPSVPSWVPWLGKSSPRAPAVAAPERRDEPTTPVAAPSLATAHAKLFDPEDPVIDRIVAIVNSDAITLAELLESIVAWRQENQGRSVSDEDVARDFLARLIDMRLQLQEAERERIVVEEVEVDEELADRIKRLPGQATKQDFEAAIVAQGLTIDIVKKRLRDSLRMSKVVRRKVTLRVSVNDKEIDRYLEENRAKLETGLSYHARHILVVPDPSAPADAAWEAARIRAELLRGQVVGGAEFADVARRHSSDASARDGGDLGILKRGELAADIEAEILKLELGAISTPYRSSLGYHLFLLESKEALEGDALLRARQQIRDILFREKYETRLAAWLREIKQRALIEVRL